MVIVVLVVGKEVMKRKERKEGKGEKERKKGMLVSRRRGGPLFLACVDFQSVCVKRASTVVVWVW